MWYEQPTPLMDVAPKPPPKDWHSGATAAMAKCSCTIGDCDKPEPRRVHAHMHKHLSATVTFSHSIIRVRAAPCPCVSVSLFGFTLSLSALAPNQTCDVVSMKSRAQPSPLKMDGVDLPVNMASRRSPSKWRSTPCMLAARRAARMHQIQYPSTRPDVCVCVRACLYACMRVCMFVRVCACVCALACKG